jgi:hypothetical protein
MMCISVEQYNRMVESYEGVMEELQELRELLQMPQGDVDEVAPAQPGHRAAEDKKGTVRECRKSIMSALKDVDDLKFLQRIYISILVAKNGRVGDCHDERAACGAD